MYVDTFIMWACQIKENKKLAMRMRGGRPIANIKLMEQMRAMHARMEAMVLARQWEPDLGDDSESEVEGGDQEEETTLETTEMKLFRSVLGTISRQNPPCLLMVGICQQKGW